MIPVGVVAASAFRTQHEPPLEGYVTITVPPQAEALAGFPVYVDLSDMPPAFWGALVYPDGRDIRVADAFGVALPFDLVSCDSSLQSGSVFIRVDLSAAVETEFRIHYGSGTDFVPHDSPTGRNSVWADYHRVYMLGGDRDDRTGSGPAANRTLFVTTPVSPDLNVHQGLCWDGTHYYVTDTNALYKYDAAWNLVASNLDPVSLVGGAADHCGDPEVWDGVVYVPIERYSSASSYSDMHIARFNAGDLTAIDATDISAQGHEASSIARNPSDGLLYISSYGDGTRLWKYTPGGVFKGEMLLSRTVNRIQGIVFLKGALYLTSSGAAPSGLWVAKEDGTGVTYVTWDRPSGVVEGVTAVGDELMVLVDGSAGAFVHAGPLLDSSSPETDHSYTWTVGSTILSGEGGGTRALLSYGATGSVFNRVRATLGLRAGNFLGVWNNVDGWLNADGVEVPVDHPSRVNAVHSQGSHRAVYWNGVGTTASSVSDRPEIPTGWSDNALFISRRDDSSSELFEGGQEFVYLRFEALSPAWLAAEAANLMSPASFYSVD